MKPEVRVCIAYIAGCLILKCNPLSIYDRPRSQRVKFGGIVEETRIDIFDKSRSSLVHGEGNGSIYNFFDYDEGEHFNLIINGNNFTGYNYKRTNYFSGDVWEDEIRLYDYGAQDYFLFYRF